MRPCRRDAGHLGEHHAGAAFGALGVVHEMPVVGRAVDGAILRHRRDADAVGDLEATHAERHEHRRPRGVGPMAGRLLLEPFLGAGEPLRIALAQVLVADALRAREQRIIELHRIEMQIALDILEPFGRIARRVLQTQHFRAPLILVAAEGGGEIGLAMDIVGERDGAFHRELGAGADREMRGGRGVAEQHDVAAAPALAQHAVEIEPGRAAQMLGVRHQRIAAEIFGEYLLAGSDGLLGVHLVEAGLAPSLFRALDDEVAVSASNW